MEGTTSLLGNVAYHVIRVFLIPVLLYYLSKFLWRIYILRTARDPFTDLSHLPIPPGDFGLPIVGETFTWAIQGSQFNIIRRKRYGKIFSSNYIGKTMVKVTGPEYVKQILTASSEQIHTIWPESARRIVGEAAISNSVGSLHKYRRKVFLRAFTRAALQSYIPRIHRIAKERMQKWLNNADETLLVYRSAREMTFEVAFNVLVGLSFKNDEEKQHLFETFDEMITNLFSLPYEFPGSGFSKALKAKSVIHSLLDDHLQKKRLKVHHHVERNEFAGESSDESLRNVLHYVLESSLLEEKRKQNGRHVDQENQAGDEPQGSAEDDHELSDTELKETTTEMLFAGYQTVASTASSVVINLIQHPECFRKLEDELREFGLLSDSGHDFSSDESSEETLDTFEPRDDAETKNLHCIFGDINKNTKPSLADISKQDNLEDREITVELLAKMPYLEQVMKETLRIGPAILGGYRKALKTIQIGKYRIPKGWTIIYNIRDTHDSEWEDDREFNPDRFSPENWKENKESRYRWIPFGGGPRMCVGKDFARIQLKIFLIELVRTFRKIEFADGKAPKMFAIPFLHPTNGLPVKLTPRYDYNVANEPKKIK